MLDRLPIRYKKSTFFQSPSFSEGSNEMFIKKMYPLQRLIKGGGVSEISGHVPYKVEFFYALLNIILYFI